MGLKPSGSRFDRARFIRLRSGQQQQREQKHHLSLSPDAARHSLRAARDAVRHDAYPARRTGRGRRSRARKARERRPRTPRISAHRVLGTRRNARGASIDRSGAMTLSPALTPDEVDAPHVASIVEQYHGAWRDRAHAPNSARAFTEVRFAPDLARDARTRVSRVRFLFSRVRLSSSPKTDRRAATPRPVDRSTALDAPRGV